MKKISYFALLVAVVTLFASCAKTELAETPEDSQKAATKLLKMLKNRGQVINVTHNYSTLSADKSCEIEIEGTLYEIDNGTETPQKLILTDKYPKVLDSYSSNKTRKIRRASIVTDPKHETSPVACVGNKDVNCADVFGWFIVMW